MNLFGSDIQGSAVFAGEGSLRMEIRRWWVDEPKRWAAWLMLNPSKAAAERNDPTAQRVTHFTRTWGYDGWIGVNLYPFVSSTPADMWQWADWEAHGPAWDVRDALIANITRVEYVARMSTIRVVGFGAEAVKRGEPLLELTLEAFEQPSDIGADDRLYCLGVNATGQPLHPLARGRMRVPNERQPTLWARP